MLRLTRKSHPGESPRRGQWAGGVGDRDPPVSCHWDRASEHRRRFLPEQSRCLTGPNQIGFGELTQEDLHLEESGMVSHWQGNAYAEPTHGFLPGRDMRAHRLIKLVQTFGQGSFAESC